MTEPRPNARLPRNRRWRLRTTPVAAFAAFAAGLFVAQPAAACPPGHYEIGGGTGGWVGCAPMDGGVDLGGESGGGSSIEDMDITAPGLSTYDPEAWSDFFAHMAEQTIEEERRQVPPHLRETYEALLAGTWLFGRSREGDEVQACMASFHTRRGGVMFLDWGGSDPGTTYSFFGEGIPRVRKIDTVRVRLEQSGEAQDVEAFHTSHPLPRMGMVMMRVPSTEALLSAIEDVQDYRLLMDERELSRSTTIIGRWRDRRGPTGRYHEVSYNTWHSGLTARIYLIDCLREQGRLPSSLAGDADKPG